jgi:aryl-alcohol dehydrogenase-like predicted oxidoreductase
MEETLQAFARLVQDGKVRVLGASNFSAPRLMQALDLSHTAGLPRYEVLQPKYNLCERAEYEGALQRAVVGYGLSAAPYKGLASGFLTGKYRVPADLGRSVRGPRAAEYLNERGLAVLHALDTVASRRRATPAQIALAWLLAQPGVTAPIASATHAGQLLELTEAVDLALDAADFATLAPDAALEIEHGG